MFDVGIGEIILVLFAALFIFGPDRLPKVAAQAARTLRDLRGMAAGARAELTDALGPEFTDLGKDLGLDELRDLTNLRSLDPRKAITSTLFGGTDDAATPTPRARPVPGASASSAGPALESAAEPGAPAASAAIPVALPAVQPAAPAAFDPDAT